MTISQFFKMAAAAILDFAKSGNFTGENGQESQNASPCQILWRSVKPLLRYGDFSTFQDGGRRHIAFSKGGNFRSEKDQDGQSAPPRQISSRSVKPLPRYGDFSIFPRWRPSAILDL